MSLSNRMLRVTLVSLGGLAAASAIALAQTASPPSPAQNGPPSASAAQNPPPTANPGGASASFPVFAVTSVEILRSTHSPSLAVIAVRGLTSSEGWEEGTLVPLTSGNPADGVLDLVLVANAPQDAAAPGTYAPIEAVLPVPELPFKAVRVRSANNTLMLKDLQGYAEAKVPDAPCGPCVGKHFVAKGGAAPAGVAASDIIRQEDLPP
ncbi:MAG TPA: hypothetical protein VL614_01730, partial [Acetobacteraceae bacterium]|nr:hypothetical protein [Acetobacteraceae bacterium]